MYIGEKSYMRYDLNSVVELVEHAESIRPVRNFSFVGKVFFVVDYEELKEIRWAKVGKD